MRVFRLARLNSDNYMCLPLPAAEKKVMILTKELCLSRSLFLSLSLSRVLLLFVSEKKVRIMPPVQVVPLLAEL